MDRRDFLKQTLTTGLVLAGSASIAKVVEEPLPMVVLHSRFGKVIYWQEPQWSGRVGSMLEITDTVIICPLKLGPCQFKIQLKTGEVLQGSGQVYGLGYPFIVGAVSRGHFEDRRSLGIFLDHPKSDKKQPKIEHEDYVYLQITQEMFP